MKAVKIVLLFAALLMILSACGTKKIDEDSQTNQNSNEMITESNQDQDPVLEETPDQAEEPEENPQDEIVNDETTLAYFVNEKYYIKPVNEEDEEKIVLLTFDDSPAGDSTQSILDTLDKYNAKAIWFINGYYADKNKELLKEIYNRGHIIGNHTWWHENLKKLSPEKTREEIVSINNLVEEVTGVRPTYFRAPFGVYSDDAKKVLKEENMQYMNWTWGSLDWELKTSEEIENNVIDHIHNGANILFHDKRITSEALEKILQTLSEEGYKFVLPTEVRIQD